tara:strand:+ start:126 stop:407 length:282 start_codon:yes stop_codon:yes gene_type:complete
MKTKNYLNIDKDIDAIIDYYRDLYYAARNAINTRPNIKRDIDGLRSKRGFSYGIKDSFKKQCSLDVQSLLKNANNKSDVKLVLDAVQWINDNF